MQFKENFKAYSRFHLNPTSIPIPTAASHRLWVFNPTVNHYLRHLKIYTSYSMPHYSGTHLKESVDYSSPHNLLLDVLYTSGIVGVILIGCFYFFLIRHTARLSAFSTKNRLLACIALSALICNIIANGLNFPFFMHFNIYPLAFICGVILYIHEDYNQARLANLIA
jgi:O-antigen ligase